MSFILDALKKSEVERQRQNLPGLMDPRMLPRRNRLPLWAVLVGALLAINVVVLSVLLARNGSSPATKPAAAVPAPGKAPPAEEHFSPLSAAPVYAPEIPVQEEATRPAAQRSAPRAGPSHRSDPLLSDDDDKGDNNEVLPTINEINAPSLPELHLDVHVYATKPADRFVYVNMRKYHEGNALPEGVTVERIRRDGVVLNYQGVRFLLPRQ
jgi:general secretion pathway protein B